MMNFVLFIIAAFYRSESAASSYTFNRVDNNFVFFDQFGNQSPDCFHFIPNVPLIPMVWGHNDARRISWHWDHG